MGVVYKLISANTDKIYIGSTTCALEKRLKRHLYNFLTYQNDANKKYFTSYKILTFGEYSMVILEDCGDISRTELLKRETYHIKANINICVNKIVPFHDSEAERQDSIKKSKQKWKDQHQDYNKIYLREYRLKKKYI